MRGGQRHLVRPQRLTHSSGRAHGLLLSLLMLSPGSCSLSLFLFTGLVSTTSPERARKAD